MPISFSSPPETITLLVSVLLLFILGIALTFWGKKIVEAVAFVVFGFLGGLLGLWLALLIIDYFGIGGILYWVILVGLCLLGIILGAWLSKSFLYGIIVFYCALYAFYTTWMIMGGEWKLVPLVIALVVGLVVGIIVKIIIEKVFAAITAFMGATLVGYGAYLSAVYLAQRFFGKHMSGAISIHDGFSGNIILICIVIAGAIVLGILGTIFQLKGGLKMGGGKKNPPPPPPNRGKQRRR
jgi:hypothetical protein